MTPYKHTQIGYLMLAVTGAVIVLFVWLQLIARAEPPSPDSGANFAMTAIMVLVVCLLMSFSTLTVSIDEQCLKLRFGWGLVTKKFLLNDITTVQCVRNHWYHGWGIHLWFWPMMRIYNVSGFDAVEISTNNGNVYRIGTDEPAALETALKYAVQKN